MEWVKLILALLGVVSMINRWANRSKLASDAQAQLVAKALEAANVTIHTAQEARRRQLERDADPARLRDDDGYKRRDDL